MKSSGTYLEYLQEEDMYRIPSSNVTMLYEQVEDMRRGKVTRESVKLVIEIELMVWWLCLMGSQINS